MTRDEILDGYFREMGLTVLPEDDAIRRVLMSFVTAIRKARPEIQTVEQYMDFMFDFSDDDIDDEPEPTEARDAR